MAKKKTTAPKKNGRPKSLDPETLWSHFLDYKRYNTTQVMFKNHYSAIRDKVTAVEQKVPMTWEGFHCYMMTDKGFGNLMDYKKNKESRYNEFAPIIETIGYVIYQEQYNGAAIGNYNASIVARKLKLAERTEINATPTINIVDMTKGAK